MNERFQIATFFRVLFRKPYDNWNIALLKRKEKEKRVYKQQ